MGLRSVDTYADGGMEWGWMDGVEDVGEGMFTFTIFFGLFFSFFFLSFFF